MASKHKAGCTCCDNCCAMMRELAADITVGGLPGITDMRIDVLTDDTCSAASDGTLGVTDQTGNGFERPTTGVAGKPYYGINVAMNGKWSRQKYAYTAGVFILDEFGYTDECYYLADPNLLSGGDLLVMQVTAISGTISLVQGNEPTQWPYWVRLEYYLYEDGAGDCILRVGAYFIPRHTVAYNADGSASYFYEGLLAGGGTWPNTRVNEIKYSDHNPCGEDLMILPVTGAPSVGIYEEGYTVELEDQGLDPPGANNSNGGSGTNGWWSVGDLSQSNDATYSDEPIGNVNSIGLLWEINLTDDSITDLNALPTTTLDTTNCIGTYEGDIRGDYTAVGDLPAGYFTNNGFWHHDTSSVVLTSGSVSQSAGHTVLNDGAGGHICKTVASPGDCVSGHPWDGGGILQEDLLYWEYSWEVDSTVTKTAWSGISIELKQPPP